MISRLWVDWRRRRLKQHAALWVMRILDDRETYAEGLKRWVGNDPVRGDAYNRAYRAVQDSRDPSVRLFGTRRERVSWAPAARVGARSWTLTTAIAPATILILVTVAVGSIALQRAWLSSAAGQSEELASRLGEIRTVVLPDGSHVILDTDSALRLGFSKTVRSVSLIRGRARFEISHDEDRPFVVTVGGATVTDKGTVFDIDTSGQVRVHLISGALEVAYPRPFWRAGPPAVRLSPGQQVRIDPLTKVAPLVPAPADPSEAQWTGTLRTFDDVPVNEIVAEANRYSASKIELADPTIGERSLFLLVDIRDTRTVARELGNQLGLTLDESEPGRLVLKQTQAHQS